MSYLTLLVFLLIQHVAFGEEEAQTQKEKQQLSPARLRAEGDAAFSNRQYTKALKYFNQLVGKCDFQTLIGSLFFAFCFS